MAYCALSIRIVLLIPNLIPNPESLIPAANASAAVTVFSQPAAQRALHNRHDAHSACFEEIPVNVAKWIVSMALVAAAGVFICAGARVAAHPQTPAKPSIAGAWTLNKDLSDAPRDRGDQGDERGRGRRGGSGRGGGGGGGRGGFGRGMGRGGDRGGGGGGMDPQEM